MPNTILLKRSNTTGAVPAVESLQVGELAINSADAKIYTKTTDGTVTLISGGLDINTANGLYQPKLSGINTHSDIPLSHSQYQAVTGEVGVYGDGAEVFHGFVTNETQKVFAIGASYEAQGTRIGSEIAVTADPTMYEGKTEISSYLYDMPGVKTPVAKLTVGSGGLLADCPSADGTEGTGINLYDQGLSFRTKGLANNPQDESFQFQAVSLTSGGETSQPIWNFGSAKVMDYRFPILPVTGNMQIGADGNSGVIYGYTGGGNVTLTLGAGKLETCGYVMNLGNGTITLAPAGGGGDYQLIGSKTLSKSGIGTGWKATKVASGKNQGTWLLQDTDADRSGVVTRFNNRTGNVSLTSSDVTSALTYTPIAAPSNSTANQVLTYNGTAWRSANHTNCITTTNGNNTFTVNSDGFGFSKIMANPEEFVFPWFKMNDNLYRTDGKRNMQLVWKHGPTSTGWAATTLTMGDTYARVHAVTGAAVGPDPGDVGFYPNGFGLNVHDYTHPYDITTKYWADLNYVPKLANTTYGTANIPFYRNTSSTRFNSGWNLTTACGTGFNTQYLGQSYRLSTTSGSVTDLSTVEMGAWGVDSTGNVTQGSSFSALKTGFKVIAYGNTTSNTAAPGTIASITGTSASGSGCITINAANATSSFCEIIIDPVTGVKLSHGQNPVGYLTFSSPSASSPYKMVMSSSNSGRSLTLGTTDLSKGGLSWSRSVNYSTKDGETVVYKPDDDLTGKAAFTEIHYPWLQLNQTGSGMLSGKLELFHCYNDGANGPWYNTGVAVYADRVERYQSSGTANWTADSLITQSYADTRYQPKTLAKSLFSGSFTTGDGKTVTIVDGIVEEIK